MSTTGPAFDVSPEEREAMLTEVAGMVKSAAGKVASRVERFTHEDREDFEQDVKVLLWKQTTNFDKSRGAKWSSYAYSIIDRAVKEAVRLAAGRLEINVDGRDWNKLAEELPADEGDGHLAEHEETATALVDAVHNQLIQGFLKQLTPGRRRLIERILFEHLTCDQIAEQDGHPVKVVRTNLKQALRTLATSGLLSHVATDAEVAKVTAPRTPQLWTAAERWVARVRKELHRVSKNPLYQERLRRIGTLELAAALELIRCDGLTLAVASQLLDRTESGVKIDVCRALRILAV